MWTSVYFDFIRTNVQTFNSKKYDTRFLFLPLGAQCCQHPTLPYCAAGSPHFFAIMSSRHLSSPSCSAAQLLISVQDNLWVTEIGRKYCTVCCMYSTVLCWAMLYSTIVFWNSSSSVLLEFISWCSFECSSVLHEYTVEPHVRSSETTSK